MKLSLEIRREPDSKRDNKVLIGEDGVRPQVARRSRTV